jgi:hypothetical protein
LADVLALASLVSTLPGDLEALEVGLSDSRDARRLNINAAACAEIMRESAEQIASLRQALGE